MQVVCIHTAVLASEENVFSEVGAFSEESVSCEVSASIESMYLTSKTFR